jgi:hypothetical protein
MSSLAVFLVLGGASAYAAKKIGSNEIKGNSITTGKIKKNAITASKIKKNSIVTSKIKSGAVTGAKINLSTLGIVPNATNATHATTADHATTAGSSDEFKTWFTTASVGQTVVLLKIGPFTYTGECASGPEATTDVETSQANSAASSYEGDDANPFNPGETLEVGGSASGNEWYGPYDGTDAQLSGDGHTYVNTSVAVGTEVGGADCTFVGNAFTLSR